MRTKDEILKSGRDDIRNKHFTVEAPLWVELRKIEVLIDIRDIVELRFCQLIDRVAAIGQKD